MCLDAGAFELILLGVHWASWKFISMPFIIIWKVIFFKPLCLFLSFPSEMPTMCMLIILMVSHRYLVSVHSLFFFCSADSIISIVLSSSLLILSSVPSNIPFNLYSKCICYCVFQLHNSFVSFRFSISLFTFLFCLCIVFLFISLCFSLVLIAPSRQLL